MKSIYMMPPRDTIPLDDAPRVDLYDVGRRHGAEDGETSPLESVPLYLTREERAAYFAGFARGRIDRACRRRTP